MPVVFKTEKELRENIKTSLEEQRNKEITEKLKQDILEEMDINERLKKATVLINREIHRIEFYTHVII